MKKKTVSKKSPQSKLVKRVKNPSPLEAGENRGEFIPPTSEKPYELKDIKSMLNFLNQSYEKMAKYVEGERNRNLTLQTFVGEAVTYELLCQSYGIPEYTTEEKLRRFLSCIMQAIDNYYKAREKQPPFNSEMINCLWNSQDPHTLTEITPNTGTIREFLVKEGQQNINVNIVQSDPVSSKRSESKKPKSK